MIKVLQAYHFRIAENVHCIFGLVFRLLDRTIQIAVTHDCTAERWYALDLKTGPQQGNCGVA